MQFSQMSIKICDERLEFLSSSLQSGIGFEVISEPTTVSLNQSETDLLAGLEQEVTLTVHTGSHCIEEVVLQLFQFSSTKKLLEQ